MAYAAADEDDQHHDAAAEFFLLYESRQLILPTLVITEVAHFFKRLGWEPEKRFLDDIATGAFMVEPVHASDWLRIGELVVTYQDFPLGTVDASIIAAAERLNIHEIATVDHRHFQAVRPNHVEAFELLP